jgi:hypothetical protein
MLKRGKISPDLTDLTETESDPVTPPDDKDYRALTADQCKCMAADHAEVASLIDREREIAQCCRNDRKQCKQQAAALHVELLAYRAAAERNQAAGEALELYFLLAEAEAGRDAIAKSKTGIERIRGFVARLRSAGLDAGIADTAVDNRVAEVLDQEAQLLLDRQKLNSELRRRLGLDVDDPTPIWPDTDLKVKVEEIDVNAAIAEGMAMRPELAATQRLLECLDRDNLSQARGTLQAFEAVLGSASAPSRLLKLASRSAECCEWDARSGQLEQLLVHLQRSAAEEIRQAVHTVETRFRQILIAKQGLESREKAVEDLKRQWGGENVSPFEIVDAQLKVVEAETDLLHHVVAWEIARAKLKQSQGLFAMECGYTEPADPVDPPVEEEPILDDIYADIEIPPPPMFPVEFDDEAGDMARDETESALLQPASVSGKLPADISFARMLTDEAPQRQPGEPTLIEDSKPESAHAQERTSRMPAHDESQALTADASPGLPGFCLIIDEQMSEPPGRSVAPVRPPISDPATPAAIEDRLPINVKRIQPRPATARQAESSLPDSETVFEPVRFGRGDSCQDEINLVIPLQMTSPPEDPPSGIRQPESVTTGVKVGP